MKVFSFSILVIALFTSCKSEIKNESKAPLDKTTEAIQDTLVFAKHWHEVSKIEGKQVIFIPCDYQNTEFIIEEGNGQQKFIEVTGQDGWQNILDSIVAVDEVITKVYVKRPDNATITFQITKLSDSLSQWSWTEKGYDGALEKYTINMTSEAYKNTYPIVEEPPCLD